MKSAGSPNKSTGMIALGLRSLLLAIVIPSTIKLESILYDLESISTKTGVAPNNFITSDVAMYVKGVVIIDGRKNHSILFELLSDKGSGTLIRQ